MMKFSNVSNSMDCSIWSYTYLYIRWFYLNALPINWVTWWTDSEVAYICRHSVIKLVEFSVLIMKLKAFLSHNSIDYGTFLLAHLHRCYHTAELWNLVITRWSCWNFNEKWMEIVKGNVVLIVISTSNEIYSICKEFCCLG